MVDAFLKSATYALVRHGAFIDKYVGDAVMAFFNAPIRYEDHAARAVASALEIEARDAGPRQQFGIDLRAAIGVASGWAHVGRLGSGEGKDYTAIGDVVNLAARLEGQAHGGEVVVDSQSTARSRTSIPDVRPEEVELKGFGGAGRGVPFRYAESDAATTARRARRASASARRGEGSAWARSCSPCWGRRARPSRWSGRWRCCSGLGSVFAALSTQVLVGAGHRSDPYPADDPGDARGAAPTCTPSGTVTGSASRPPPRTVRALDTPGSAASRRGGGDGPPDPVLRGLRAGGACLPALIAASASPAETSSPSEVAPHLHLLYRMALRLTQEEQAAEDLLQDTLERAFLNSRGTSPAPTSEPGCCGS